MKKAIVITDGVFDTNYAKTAHGLIRGSDRFEIVAVVDKNFAGEDAGTLLDGIFRNIPIVTSILEAVSRFEEVTYFIIGVATNGGKLTKPLLDAVREAILFKLNIVNGLHQLLADCEDIVALAKQHEVELIDIRKPKILKELHFWSGEIFKIKTPIIAVLGMDCGIGKRTTTRLLLEALKKSNIKSEMIYTGQTGWMQGSKYGFIFDTTRNDFVCGELEHAILSCWKNENPEVILLEGQSGLRNPSGPCGLELIISGNAKQVVLVHAPARVYFDDEEEWGKIPSVASEIEIIEKFGSKVIAVALNINCLSKEEIPSIQSQLEKSLGIPVVVPITESVDRIVSAIKFSDDED